MQIIFINYLQTLSAFKKGISWRGLIFSGGCCFLLFSYEKLQQMVGEFYIFVIVASRLVMALPIIGYCGVQK